ncbi:hypothetical protein HYN56_12610 [Flavobacterium crocinum]|uniref:Uncharacterized protein n=1 Tax=Flavobacterium crocinum TaxID=2183896 RepID=A0A2S1YLV1_9FLAO|nr:hypothetical protein [Flavobacterium crocinum]AWK05023.1 hypothetical protein HYN56_12610 [Flavobacterium crocinum]
MISQIGIQEFRARLKANTKIGNPKISGTPLHAFNMIGEKNKLFYGTFGENNFKITSNAILFPLPYILKGKIKSKNLNQTEISYEIIPIQFGYYWIRYFPFIAFLLFNIIFIIEKPPLSVWIIFNLFIVFIGAISNLRMYYKRKNFEIKFIKLFEISNGE